MKSGSLNAVVGENGSGKSTLLKIIVGRWRGDSGKVTFKGKIGYCPQQSLIFSDLTVDENFRYFSAAYGLDQKTSLAQSEHLLEHFDFKRYHKDKVSTLSGGTQQKLNLSLALLHQPDLLVLDEPYNGFDWETYLRFWDLTNELRKKGCIILIVCHLVNEIERFDRIYNLKNGYLD
jgi:ABC-type multidrug transport system ATPase subunit